MLRYKTNDIITNYIDVLSGPGNGISSGRVEIFDPDFGWGTVCDDSWDIHAGHVVCRQLGFLKAIKVKFAAYYGEGTGRILLDEVNCKGDESNILDCAHGGRGEHDCSHGEDAGVGMWLVEFKKATFFRILSTFQLAILYITTYAITSRIT